MLIVTVSNAQRKSDLNPVDYSPQKAWYFDNDVVYTSLGAGAIGIVIIGTDKIPQIGYGILIGTGVYILASTIVKKHKRKSNKKGNFKLVIR